MSKAPRTLRLILGDQITPEIATLRDANPTSDIIFMAEVMEEVTYVKHHQKKIAFLFSAMRHFAKALSENGFNVAYTKLDDPLNGGSFNSEIERAIAFYGIEQIIITSPGEYRLLQIFESWEEQFGVPVLLLEDDRFLCTKSSFLAWAKSRNNLRMDAFYQFMRKTHECLLENGNPVGGKWSFDTENREKPDPKMKIPTPKSFEPDEITLDVIELVKTRCDAHFGSLDNFNFAVDRSQALEVLEEFITERLPTFGRFQDAMIENEPFMYHSLISLYLNCGLLNPLEIIRAAENALQKGSAPLNSVEGFIRQLLGWREFIRGIYWLKMPQYKELNFFGADRKLPDFYWSGNTRMKCMAQAVQQTRQYGYAHHIQRLMVLGNFALLAGIYPKEVNDWFLTVYTDAYEWVELPNVSGMALFADGGLFATKPYAASGAYINRMSNYCKTCHYKVSEKNGETACPFNYLYWNFLKKNRPLLEGNIRLKISYRTLDKMTGEKLQIIESDSETFLSSLP